MPALSLLPAPVKAALKLDQSISLAAGDHIIIGPKTEFASSFSVTCSCQGCVKIGHLYRVGFSNRNTFFSQLWSSKSTNRNKRFFDWKINVIPSSLSFIFSKQFAFFWDTARFLSAVTIQIARHFPRRICCKFRRYIRANCMKMIIFK